MTEECCPRCHEPLPLVPGHLPAYRLRHQRASGQTCIVYAGAPVREEVGSTLTALRYLDSHASSQIA